MYTRGDRRRDDRGDCRGDRRGNRRGGDYRDNRRDSRSDRLRRRPPRVYALLRSYDRQIRQLLSLVA